VTYGVALNSAKCCEIWLLTLREEQSLREFENAVLRRIFKSKREEAVTGGWRKLHNEGLHNLYYLPNIITVIISKSVRWMGHAARGVASPPPNPQAGGSPLVALDNGESLKGEEH
jgi:hypothetical protein